MSYNFDMTILDAPMPNQNNLADKQPVSIAILGAGAIGCLIASQIPTSYNTFILPRSDSSSTAKTSKASFEFSIEDDQGITRHQLDAWSHSLLDHSLLDNSALDKTPLDIVIICCKASQTLSALAQWKSAITDQTQIVILQNGLGQHDQVHDLFPNNTLFAATTTEGANRKNRHFIRHAGKGVTQWGYYAGPTHSLKLDLKQLFGDHSYNENIKQALLDKLAINAAINPLTVKYNCPNGELITNPIAFEELKDLCDEIESCLKALNVSLSFPLFDRAQSIALSTQKNISSMLQDVRNQQETEIDFINNYLINQALQFNKKNQGHIELPINQSLVDLIKQTRINNRP